MSENQQPVMTSDQMRQYIDQQFMQLSAGISQVMTSQMSELMQRIIGIESVLCDKVKGVTKSTLVNKLAELQDESSGYIEVDTVQAGDRVRFTLKTQKLPSRDVEVARHLIDDIGSGRTLGQYEKELIGMKALQSKTLLVEEGGEQYKVTFEVNRVSRTKNAKLFQFEKPENSDTETPTSNIDAEVIQLSDHRGSLNEIEK